MTKVETVCENCGRTFGKLEAKHVWQDEHVVCGACLATLKVEQATEPTSAPAAPPAPDPSRVCTNCGGIIGKMEEPKFWQREHLVCQSCYAKLHAQFAPVPAQAQAVQRVEVVNTRRGPSAGRIGYRIITGAIFVWCIISANVIGMAAFGLVHCLSYLPTKRERESA